MKKFTLNLLVVVCLLNSCSSNDDSGPSDNELVAPATYQFLRNGSNSVSYNSETIYILMGEEFITALKDNSKTEAELDGMFSNTGNFFSTSDLNDSGKSLRNKIAASNDYFSANSSASNSVKAEFDDWISNQVNIVFPNWSTNASAGIAGKIQEVNGAQLYVNTKGVENNRVINKALIGALFIDQILNNYLSTSILDAGNNRANNENEVLDGSNNYTAMEHSWDEAFGFVYGNDNAIAPQLNQDIFLNQYLKRVDNDDDFNGIAQDIYDAFKLGRAAIVAKNYTVRDQQAEIIRAEISKIIGIRAVFYLQQAKERLGIDTGRVFHDLSEGIGFIHSLQFTRKPGTIMPYFTNSEVDTMIAQLMENNGLWDVTAETLDSISNTIAGRFNFTVSEAKD